MVHRRGHRALVRWYGPERRRSDAVDEADRGTTVATIAVDALGNFYTTEPLPMPDTELYPSILNTATGKTIRMPWPTTTGACNFCHLQNAGGQPTFMLP